MVSKGHIVAKSLSNIVTAMAERFIVDAASDTVGWVTDIEPWRRCWLCDSRTGTATDEYCGACGARFAPRRYRAEFHQQGVAGMMIDQAVLQACTLDLLKLPKVFEVFAYNQGVVAVAQTVDGQTTRPLVAHDALLLARALLRGWYELWQHGLTLGAIDANDIVLHSDGVVWLRCAPGLTVIQHAESDEVHAAALVLMPFVEVPRITRKFDISDADVHPLSVILAAIRSGTVSTFAEAIRQVEEALRPYEQPRTVHWIQVAGTDVGRKRAINEDNLFYHTMSWLRFGSAHTVSLAMVADGMGGHAAGEVASSLAIQGMTEHLLAGQFVPLSQVAFAGDMAAVVQAIDDAVQYANELVVREAERLRNDMGTTLTMVLTLNDLAYVVNVGDSRTYLWRDGQLRRITTDHSLVMKLVELEHISEDEIYTHPQRNGVLRSFGAVSGVQADIFVERVRVNDLLLLCSDGLWELVRDQQIAEILRKAKTPHDACAQLVSAANQAGGDDNISVILMRCFA